MPFYFYQARNISGEEVTGRLESGSRSEALQALAMRNLQAFLLRLEGETVSNVSDGDAKKPSVPAGKLSGQEVLYFTEDLADLLESGIQLEPALDILERRQTNPKVRSVATTLRQSVRDGASFSRALRSHPLGFGELYASMMEAGELSGSLPKILRRQAESLAASQELQRRTTAALIYPAFLIAAGTGLIIVFMTVLLPRLMGLMTKTGGHLPLVTQILIGTSGVLVNYWWLWLSLIAAFVIGFTLAMRRPLFRLAFDQYQFRVPLLGKILRLQAHARITHTLGILLVNGLPLVRSLQLMNRGNQNRYLHGQFETAGAQVEEGVSLKTALQRSSALDPATIDMIAIAEQTGRLGPALLKISARLEKMLGVQVERLTAIIQPSIIVFVALLVGFVAYSIFTGIFQSISSLRMQH